MADARVARVPQAIQVKPAGLQALSFSVRISVAMRGLSQSRKPVAIAVCRDR
jgi:hypothetical protein